ncbi:hypothetical protein B0J18DRAFT_215562 [Chaetomium sp. MPI-SDFR-AT-0129]|nr:hypothetical protein B0J18DRAFT_215562 [Chaetomium sp. MPI-SDFR-AT-0129]
MAAIFDFGGRNLVNLYETVMTRDHVFAYLDSVIANGGGFNPPIQDNVRADLQTIRDQIALLSLPNGAEYSGNATLRPNQHLRRSLNAGWNAQPRTAPSKFDLLVQDAHFWRKQRPEGLELPYWSPYDLLGLFLSKMGPAPNRGTADRDNFYIPLVAVYARFCMLIAGNKRPALTTDPARANRRTGGAGDASTYYQCTWEPRSGQFFLGAVLAGYKWEVEDGVGTWRPVVRETRHDLLNGFHGFPGQWQVWTQSPTNDRDGRDTLFGNCAETFPFLELLAPHYNPTVRARMRGRALHRDFASQARYVHNNITTYCDSPCLNCKQLLNWAGVAPPYRNFTTPRRR